MKYLIYAPLQLLCMLICYMTNWLVVLFADERGELHGVLRLWQTWDDTLDNPAFIQTLPDILNYNWHEHYIQTITFNLIDCRQVYHEILIKPFSRNDKVKRYICRVLWLYRNCGYGFAYYLFGANICQPVHTKLASANRYLIQDDRGHWAFKCDSKIYGQVHWKIYLGWKIQRKLNYGHRAMLATRFWFGMRRDSK